MSEHLILEFREWSAWIAEWLIVALIIRSIAFERKTYEMAVKEYEYDEAKDLKKRRTKTTKKTTNFPNGEIVTEENTESVETKENSNG